MGVGPGVKHRWYSCRPPLNIKTKRNVYMDKAHMGLAPIRVHAGVPVSGTRINRCTEPERLCTLYIMYACARFGTLHSWPHRTSTFSLEVS